MIGCGNGKKCSEVLQYCLKLLEENEYNYKQPAYWRLQLCHGRVPNAVLIVLIAKTRLNKWKPVFDRRQRGHAWIDTTKYQRPSTQDT